jgi:signal transduction histidine kinase
MEPMVFTQRYSEVMSGQDKVAALIGTDDRLTRAALTMTDLARMNTPLRSPLWSELSRTDVGDFENTSPVDGVHRRFHFRHLAGLPLIMVTGFSEADVQRNTLQNIKPFAMATALTLVVALTMAYLLAVALKRRDEQERFLSMISHELRTPMSVISVLSGTSAMSEDVGRRIGRAVASMDAIIDSALQSDRLRYGKVSVSLQDCAPRPLLQDMLGSATEPERLHLETPALPLLRTDPQLLRTIVSNLISNALKYSAPGTAVEILARPITHRRRQGIGITVSNQVGAAGSPDARQIFRKYYRAPGAHGKSGSGLGLHIAEGLARLLGGHLRHSSEKDQVQFTLWIPL